MESLSMIPIGAIIETIKLFLFNNWSIVIGVVAAIFAVKLLKAGLKVVLYVLIVSLVIRIIPGLMQLF